ncbi:hypothetical protein GOP47_0003381 [Adiantum capillus-veneris]|uniref:Uncharacterized protein n=1 Tax=Adiantum capillus-veneris TaxID=13818 RepID=A0A9D4VCC5_ADICA|nr:hypothetical protein GOP47_0003381 [Adiantum capillus-veneris]
MEAMSGTRVQILYVTDVYTGTGKGKPDYLETVDAYSLIIHRLPVNHLEDELHHIGWNACSSCYGDASVQRQFLILPSLVSSIVYVVDTAKNPKAPILHKVVEPQEVVTKTGIAYPNTSHCLVDGTIMISCLDDKDSNAERAGFLLLNPDFDV